MFDVIVVGADGSETARRAVEAAVEIAATSGAALHVVSGYDAKSYSEAGRPAEFSHLSSEGEVDALLQTLSFIARNRGLEAQLHSGSGDPAELIVSTAERVGADLVVVGNRGMKGVRRVLGSVPNTVAHGSPCSVLIVDTTE
ncbi:MAG: universal stress protein [Acidimicrobiales bacterium]